MQTAAVVLREDVLQAIIKSVSAAWGRLHVG